MLCGGWALVAGTASAQVAPQPAPAPAQAAALQPVVGEAIPQDPELTSLLDRLTRLSEYIGSHVDAPEIWRTHLEEFDVLQRLAARCSPDERSRWLRMAIDSMYSAVVQSPGNEQYAVRRMAQLPGQIVRTYPASNLYVYAALQEIRASHMHSLSAPGADSAKADAAFASNLLHFAQSNPQSPEAPKAILDAGQTWESLKDTNEACRCYRCLLEKYPQDALARKAEGSLWRLGLGGEAVHLKLPLLYSAADRPDLCFDIEELRGKVVVVYFWSVMYSHTGEDFDALKRLAERYQCRGLAVVYVNLDPEPGPARDFLSGRLTTGEHLYQSGGLDGAVAERYGLQTLPQVFLIGRNGNLLRHSLQVPQLNAELAGSLASGR
jgi:hypothetical protein